MYLLLIPCMIMGVIVLVIGLVAIGWKLLEAEKAKPWQLLAGLGVTLTLLVSCGLFLFVQQQHLGPKSQANADHTMQGWGFDKYTGKLKRQH